MRSGVRRVTCAASIAHAGAALGRRVATENAIRRRLQALGCIDPEYGRNATKLLCVRNMTGLA